MLSSLIWILLTGFFTGQIVARLKIPALVGMVLAGILLGPQISNVISPVVLNAADSLRTIAVMVILMKAGLGLDREKLAQQGSVALRLGFLPAACEAIVIAVGAMWLLKFDFLTGLLLGCIIGAESPAVIVPGMLRLKSLGWGVKKGIPDAILTGSALSDVMLLLVFSLLLAFLTQSTATNLHLPGGFVLTPLQQLPFQVVLQIVLGLLIGWLTARMLGMLLAKRTWTQNGVQDALVAASFALLLVVFSQSVPVFSGYLAVMATGFFVIEQNAPLARRLRVGFNGLWVVAEIVLFVLLGASIQLQVLESTLVVGVILLMMGTLMGRSLGWYLSTLGSNWTPQEKLFLLPGNSAKATVQAAIGAVPLAQGLDGGEAILAISALSILITAPLGAWAIPTFAPKLLQQGKVDATKVEITRKVTLLAAVNASSTAILVLTKAAELARQGDGEIIVIHVVLADSVLADSSHAKVEWLRNQTAQLLADIPHQFIVKEVVREVVVEEVVKEVAEEVVLEEAYIEAGSLQEGAVSQAIIRFAQHHAVTEIVMGKRVQRDRAIAHRSAVDHPTSIDRPASIGAVSKSVLAASSLPVIVVS